MELNASRKLLLYAIFTASGFCALVYEMLWTKFLSLVFGTTMPAVTIVAATFMGGLALGSYLVGRLADHRTDLLRLYAVLEVGIAVFALVSVAGLKLVVSAHVLIEQAFPSHPLFAHAVHFAFAAILLAPPTICMGGTFPLMCRLFARRRSGGQIGRLYAMNTFGATAGAFSSGYLLIPSLGLSTTLCATAAVNLAIAAGAWQIGRALEPGVPVDVSCATRPRLPFLARRHLLPLASIALIGFLSLAYEILWTRVLLLFLGNTTYAFSLMLSAFLVGLALGGAIYARQVRPELDERKVMINLSLLMGLVLVLSVPFYDRLAHVFQWAHQTSGENWWLLTLLSFLVVTLIVGLPTIVSGSLLPATVALIDPGQGKTGEGVGLVVLFNTVGALAGALLAGFLLVPALGTQKSFVLLATLNLALALLLLWRYRPAGRQRLAVPALALAGAAWIWIAPPWDAALMNSGVYVYAPKYAQMGGMTAVLAKERIREVIEGEETTVAVHESLDGQMRFFTVNGKTDGGSGHDMATQLLVGHLPMLAHPAPRNVLVIGLGTGITLRGLSAHPTERIDCVEISPEVVRAERWFREANGNALSDPKIHLSVDDGRDLLLTAGRRYDVIVSEPSNPWQSGNANLFTADFYRLAASRLNPGGLFCQWLGLYDITEENLRITVNTFLSVFPRAMTFKAGSDLILVGGRDELRFDYRDLSRRLSDPVLSRTLAEIDLYGPGDLLARHYLYNEGPLYELSRGAAINTDDRPILEYSARYLLGEHTLGEFQQQNMEALLAVRGKVTLPLVNLGASDGEIAVALRELARGYTRTGRQAEADYLLQTAGRLEAGAPAPRPDGT
jgi:spermidine synthase